MRNKSEGEEYIESYPKYKKWICQCVKCQEIGHKIETPDSKDHVGFRNIKKFFKPLNLVNGLCEFCRK